MSLRPTVPIVLAALALAASAQAQPTDVGVVPVRVVDGHLVVLADLVGQRYQDDVSMEISLDYPDALTLHPDQHAWLGMDPQALKRGEDPFVELRIEPGIVWRIPGRSVVAERSPERVARQNDLTKLHAAALGERKLKGTIGVAFLRQYHVTFDVAEGRLVLAPPRASGDASPSLELADVTIAPFDDGGNRVRVDLRYADDRVGRMAIGGTGYDTVIDAATARALGKPAGDVSPVWLAASGAADSVTADGGDGRGGIRNRSAGDRRLDLSRYMAFRPASLDGPTGSGGGGGVTGTAGAERPAIVTGVNLLEAFRVEIDWTNRAIGFTQKKAPEYPRADFAFFQASVQGGAEAVRAYLETYPDARLSPDATRLLMRRRLDEPGATDDQLMEALRWIVRTSPPGRRAENCGIYVDVFAILPDRTDLVIASATEALTHSRDAIDVTRVYRLHNTLGEQFLKKNDLTRAWAHFLASAFILPNDPMVSLNLARVYDRQGRARRAYSRYKRVAAAGSLGEAIDGEITAAMDRLRKTLPQDDILLIGDKAEKRP